MHSRSAIDIHLFSCRWDTGPSILSINPGAVPLPTVLHNAHCIASHCSALVETHLKASQDWDYTSTSYALLFCTAKLKCVISSVCNRGCTIWVPWSDFINDCSSPGGWWHLGDQHHAACPNIIQCGLRRNWIALVNTSEKKLPGIWTLGSFLVAFV